MVAGSFTEEYESPIAVERLWKAGVLDAHVLMPKLLPDFVTGVVVVEGDGGVGTVTQFNFSEAMEEYKFVKDRVDVCDHDNHVFKYTVLEGGLLGPRLTAYSYELKLEAAAGGGTKGKLTVNYVTGDDSPPTEEEVEKLTIGVVTMTKALDKYLEENLELYA